MASKWYRVWVFLVVMVLMVMWFYAAGKHYPLLLEPELILFYSSTPNVPSKEDTMTLPPTEFYLPGNLPLPRVNDTQKDRLDRIKRVCQRFRTELYRPHYRGSKSNFFRASGKHRYCSPDMCPMLVDFYQRIFFCFIPKVASSTIKQLFAEARNQHLKLKKNPPNDLNNLTALHISANEELPRVGPLFFQHRELRSFHKMVIVRHPFERIMSAYRDKVDKPREEIEFFYKTYWDKYLAKLNRTMLTFANFVDYLLETPVEAYDPHWAPYYLRCEPCLINYNYIGKLDGNTQIDGENSIDELRKRLGLPTKAIRLNSRTFGGKRSRRHVSEYSGQMLARKSRNVADSEKNAIDADFQDFGDVGLHQPKKTETKGNLSPNAIKTEQLNELTMEELFIQLDQNKLMQLYKKYQYDFELFGYHIVNYMDIFQNR